MREVLILFKITAVLEESERNGVEPIIHHGVPANDHLGVAAGGNDEAAAGDVVNKIAFEVIANAVAVRSDPNAAAVGQRGKVRLTGQAKGIGAAVHSETVIIPGDDDVGGGAVKFNEVCINRRPNNIAFVLIAHAVAIGADYRIVTNPARFKRFHGDA